VNIIKAGQLRHRVQIQRNTSTTANSYGQVLPNWETIATRWASIEYVRGNEYDYSREMQGRNILTVKLRYTDLTIKDRFLFGSRVLEIASIDNTNERNKELLAKCVETN